MASTHSTMLDDCWARPNRLTAYELDTILNQVNPTCVCGSLCEWDRPRRLTTIELDELLYDVYVDLYGEPI